MNTDKSIYVTDIKFGKEYNINILAGHILKILYQNGNFSEVVKNSKDCLFRIEYDCPFLFPLENQNNTFKYKDKTFNFSHWKETRGNHGFSTLDVYRLSEFSTFLIEGEIEDLGINLSGNKPGEGAMGIATECVNMLDHLNTKINLLSPKRINLETNKILSVRITLGRKGNPPQSLVNLVIPYNSVIDLRSSSEKMDNIDTNELHQFLNEKKELKQYFASFLDKPEKESSFIDSVFKLTHDFAFYVNERPEAISKLKEELIRDLFLIPIKTYVFSAEAEAYIYDGKLDYRITNVNNKYEIISGEFKIWSGIESFNECYMQISEKHTTGNESEVYLIMINKNNKDIHGVYNQMIKELKRKETFNKTIRENISLSKAQLFSRHLIQIKGHSVSLVLGIINAYYVKV
jgi:hypothetical protein